MSEHTRGSYNHIPITELQQQAFIDVIESFSDKLAITRDGLEPFPLNIEGDSILSYRRVQEGAFTGQNSVELIIVSDEMFDTEDYFKTVSYLVVASSYLEQLDANESWASLDKYYEVTVEDGKLTAAVCQSMVSLRSSITNEIIKGRVNRQQIKSLANKHNVRTNERDFTVADYEQVIDYIQDIRDEAGVSHES